MHWPFPHGALEHGSTWILQNVPVNNGGQIHEKPVALLIHKPLLWHGLEAQKLTKFSQLNPL